MDPVRKGSVVAPKTQAASTHAPKLGPVHDIRQEGVMNFGRQQAALMRVVLRLTEEGVESKVQGRIGELHVIKRKVEEVEFCLVLGSAHGCKMMAAPDSTPRGATANRRQRARLVGAEHAMPAFIVSCQPIKCLRWAAFGKHTNHNRASSLGMVAATCSTHFSVPWSSGAPQPSGARATANQTYPPDLWPRMLWMP